MWNFVVGIAEYFAKRGLISEGLASASRTVLRGSNMISTVKSLTGDRSSSRGENFRVRKTYMKRLSSFFSRPIALFSSISRSRNTPELYGLKFKEARIPSNNYDSSLLKISLRQIIVFLCSLPDDALIRTYARLQISGIRELGVMTRHAWIERKLVSPAGMRSYLVGLLHSDRSAVIPMSLGYVDLAEMKVGSVKIAKILKDVGFRQVE